MIQKIRVGIVGYGNLGKGAELAIGNNPDMELVAVFSRRSLPPTVSGVPVVSIDDAAAYKDKIDVMLLCGGSATDLMEQGPLIASLFHTVDSFDTHAKINGYFASMNKVAMNSGTVATISVGWDPGLFSLNRLVASAVLPHGTDHTFWGRGVSQGHSDAIRRIAGVKDAKQYTVPRQQAIASVRAGEASNISSASAHIRDCYVVAKPGADLDAITKEIKNMPYYFEGYETHVTFISEKELQSQYEGYPHGGLVFRTGSTSPNTNHIIEFALKLDSNPEFTGSVLVAYARATYRLAKNGTKGAFTVLDIPFSWLSAKSGEELRATLL
jgi:diaminopimelate dehydrogenase